MQTVERVVLVLDALAEGREGLGVAQLAAVTGLPLATLHRVLEGLGRHGYVCQDRASRRYRLGFRILYLSHRQRWVDPLCEMARGALHDCRDWTGETVFLAVLDGDDVVCAEKVDGVHPARYLAQVGRRLPPHCTASGKAIAAFLPRADRARLLRAPLTPHTACTVTQPDALEAQLAEVRRDGYAVCAGEYEPDVVAVAAPVFDAAGGVLGSVTLLGPPVRLSDEVRRQAVEATRAAAGRISRELLRAAPSGRRAVR